VGVVGVVVVGIGLGEVVLSELQPTMDIVTPLKRAKADFTVKSRRLMISSNLLAGLSIVNLLSSKKLETWSSQARILVQNDYPHRYSEAT
jgi:hypothetical protein